MMLNDVQRIIDTLTVPAAEYVPAISDALTLLDELAEKLRHPQPHPVTEDARDGERLDWLESRWRISAAKDCSSGKWSIHADHDLFCRPGDTLRAAIDAARAATSGSEGEGR